MFSGISGGRLVKTAVIIEIMENSDKLLFENDASQWYVAVDDRWAGPLTGSDIYKAIRAHKLTPAHYIWKRGQSEWKRICDTKVFESLAPQPPNKIIRDEIKASLKPVVKQATPKKPGKAAPPPVPRDEEEEVTQPWFLFYSDTQFGPFSSQEVRKLLRVGKIHSRVYGWRDGMENWERLEKVPEFKSVDSKKLEYKLGTSQQRSDKRRAPRRPLIAKILISDEQSVIVGVCRDISIGGLQVLTERIPANVGARLKMNISPSGTVPGKRLDPFVAEGVIVRILEDGRGFSFRFEKLTEKSKKAIEAYVE
jgi:hypothetical protein